MYEETALSSVAKTLGGSTMLQAKLQENSSPNLTRSIFNMVLRDPMEFMNHHRSTYVVQTLTKVLGREDLLRLIAVVEKHFLLVSENKCGTHVVQALLKNQFPEVVQVNIGLIPSPFSKVITRI